MSWIRHPLNCGRPIAAIGLLAVASGCGGSTSTIGSVARLPNATPITTANATPTPVPTSAPVIGDDWITFAHDQARTGYQAQDTGLSSQTAPGLQLRWEYAADEGIYSSPVVYGGLVIVASFYTGTITALSASSGSVVWQLKLGGQTTATPTIADNTLFIGTHLFGTGGPTTYYPVASNFYAINLLDGSIKWQVPLVSEDRSSPVVNNGVVYVGVAGGDPPTCLQGGVDAFDESTGAAIWQWQVNPVSGGGGAVWGPLAYDGSRIIAGTGNTCNTPVMTANSIVALNPANGNLDWSLVAQQNSASDDDTGSGVMVSGADAFAMSKDGSFYSVDRSNGQLQFSKMLNPVDLSGGWSTPTTDGTTIVVGTGLYGTQASAASAQRARGGYYQLATHRSAALGSSYGELEALDFSGNVKWTVKTQNQFFGYAAINNGVVVAGLDDAVVALNLASGSTLWSYATPALVDASPVIVPSGVYAVDTNGNVYAFTIPATASSSARRRR